ncbi:MAG: hypothetical protein JNL70_13930 [Saprospiraceae bacterium]|nr:hypothetical protein [Saprospiraceae bacterium]
MGKYLFLLLLIITLPFYQCKKDNPLSALTNAFEKAEKDIVDQSISWQNTLKELESKVKYDVSDVIRNDLTYLIKSSIANVGVEFRCNGAYLRDGLRREIRRIKNRFLADNGLATYQVTYLPNICHVLPNVITPTTTSVEIYGYDLLREHVNVYLQSTDGSKKNINQYVNFQSHFQLTIQIGGINGLPIAINNQKILLECESCDIDHKFLSEVGFQTPNLKQVKIDAVGGQGGSVFLDEPIQSEMKRIGGLRLIYGSKINAIAVVWQPYIGGYKWGIWHGGYNSGGRDTVISFDYDEEWIGIAGRSGAVIDQLLIQTTKRTIGPFGGTGGTPFDLLNQGQIVGIHGRASSFLDALGLIVRK